MNKLERLIFIAMVLDEAGIHSSPLEYGLTVEDCNKVAEMCEEYSRKVNLEALEQEGLKLIKELAKES